MVFYKLNNVWLQFEINSFLIKATIEIFMGTYLFGSPCTFKDNMGCGYKPLWNEIRSEHSGLPRRNVQKQLKKSEAHSVIPFIQK